MIDVEPGSTRVKFDQSPAQQHGCEHDDHRQRELRRDERSHASHRRETDRGALIRAERSARPMRVARMAGARPNRIAVSHRQRGGEDHQARVRREHRREHAGRPEDLVRQESARPSACHQPRCAASGGEHQALGEALPNQTAGSCAERQPYARRPARGRPRGRA